MDTRTRAGDPSRVGKQFGGARNARQMQRTEAAIVREDKALELYATGLSGPEICRQMAELYGMSAHQATVDRIIRRGLARRAANEPEKVKVARQMLMDRYDAIFQAHMPEALGRGVNPVPDVRAAELVLKVLDKMGEILGVRTAPPVAETHNTFNINVPSEATQARDAILIALARERDKHAIVEGHLAAAGTGLRELTDHSDENDTIGPPPGVITTQESEEA
jgi:hypothetical protein